MSVMATGGRLFADVTCKVTMRIWKENGKGVVKKFKYKLPFMYWMEIGRASSHPVHE